MGLENHISFFPFTNEPNYIFERIDITVLSSLYKEGLPNVLLESMAMKVPVVSSNLGGVPELVIEGETGYLVQPGDHIALSVAIKKLWSDQEMYQKMKLNARNLITQKFNKAIQFDRFKDHFFHLIHPI
jgi:glycosyltransferase involved in cell wall biosynthesis